MHVPLSLNLLFSNFIGYFLYGSDVM